VPVPVQGAEVVDGLLDLGQPLRRRRDGLAEQLSGLRRGQGPDPGPRFAEHWEEDV